jgi:hypothetical protein
MKLHVSSVLITLLALLGVASFAASPGASPAGDDQTQAQTLLERARKLSDIRSASAPAFRLKASFTVTAPDLSTVEGTYIETWQSNTQWRRETVLGPARRVEVGGATKRWQLDTGTQLPAEVQQFSGVLDLTPSWWKDFTFEPPTDHEVKIGTLRCMVTPLAETGERFALCFYKDSGLLAQVIMPKKIGVRLGTYSCQYGEYQKFGDYVFPRLLACFQEGHRKLKAEIVELSSNPSPDATLFSPPTGAVELGNNVDHPLPPKPAQAMDPRFPF